MTLLRQAQLNFERGQELRAQGRRGETLHLWAAVLEVVATSAIVYHDYGALLGSILEYFFAISRYSFRVVFLFFDICFDSCLVDFRLIVGLFFNYFLHIVFVFANLRKCEKLHLFQARARKSMARRCGNYKKNASNM